MNIPKNQYLRTKLDKYTEYFHFFQAIAPGNLQQFSGK
jgi:hypothetical protein